jgi:hypothetical protein
MYDRILYGEVVMRTVDVNGYRVQHSAVLFGKLYYFCIDVEGTYYMIKVQEDGTLDIL